MPMGMCGDRLGEGEEGCKVRIWTRRLQAVVTSSEHGCYYKMIIPVTTRVGSAEVSNS